MKSFLILIPVAVVVLGSTACSRGPKAAEKKESGPVAVRVAKVTSRTVSRSVDTVGTLFPYDEAIISAEIEGRIEQVNADLGDSVKQGQILVKIGDEEQRYLVAQQEAQLRQSLERLGLQSEKDKVQDIRQTPDYRRAQADFFDAEQRYKRVRNLVDQGIGPQSDLDQAQARFQSAQAALDQTLYQTRNLIQEVERFKAVLDLQRKKLRDTTVLAPFAGFVKERQTVIGQYVRANAPLFTLVKIDPLRLRIEVPERMAPWVKIGQKAEVIVEAFAGRSFEGKVWRISPTVDQTKRTFIVEALIENPRQELKPGSYARARIGTDLTENVRIIPSRALSYVLGTNKAYVVKGDTIEARDIKIGDRLAQEIEIIQGLEDGETVAVTGLNRLDTGSKVRIQEEAK